MIVEVGSNARCGSSVSSAKELSTTSVGPAALWIAAPRATTEHANTPAATSGSSLPCRRVRDRAGIRGPLPAIPAGYANATPLPAREPDRHIRRVAALLDEAELPRLLERRGTRRDTELSVDRT